ncbi:MAG: hypothetical protein ACOYLS_13100 [Polymorphobacter sp.]
MMQMLRKLIVILAIAATSFSAVSAKPARIDCEANMVATQRAIDAELQSQREAKRAGATLVSGAGCALISVFLLGLDGGMTSVACGIVMAGTYGAMSAAEATQVSNEVYARMRDKRCIGK